MKKPGECENMQDIRTEIDRIDKDLITLIGERFNYVKAAAKYKTNEGNVRAPERFKAMLEQRRIWAEENGLNADMIEDLYRNLVNYFIEEEMQHWKSKNEKQ